MTTCADRSALPTFFTCKNIVFNILISSRAQAVYSYFERSANRLRQCYPSHKTIAGACGMSVATVKRAIRELLTLGLVHVLDQYKYYDNGRRQTVNLYTLLSISEDKQLRPDKKDRDSKHFFKCDPIIYEAPVSKKAVCVYLYLSKCADSSLQCHPDKKEIAGACGMSVASVTRAIRELKNSGLIAVSAQYTHQGNGRSNNLYTLLQVAPEQRAALSGSEQEHAEITQEPDERADVTKNTEALVGSANGVLPDMTSYTDMPEIADNGASQPENEYVPFHKNAGVFRRLFASLLCRYFGLFMRVNYDPLPHVNMTYQGTKSITKDTLKQRKKDLYTKLIKSKWLKSIFNHAGFRNQNAICREDTAQASADRRENEPFRLHN